MPKVEIDYSNTIIYKITCNDSNVTDKYVGHTTNFVQRKHAHKHNCSDSLAQTCKLYKTIVLEDETYFSDGFGSENSLKYPFWATRIRL